MRRYLITLLRRNRVTVAARRYQDFLPPIFVARLYDDAPELMAPPHPTGDITAAMNQMRRRAYAAALAPWRQAIADAREAARASHKQAAAAREAARAADPSARVRPPRSRSLRASPGRPTPQALLAALLAELHAPERAAAAHDARLTEPYVPFPPASPAAPRPMPGPDAHRSAHAVPVRCARATSAPEPYVPERAPTAHNVCAAEPYEPFPPARAAAPTTAPSQDPHPTAPAAPARQAHANGQPEPLVPGGAPGPRQTSAPEPYVPVRAAAGPVLPPGLPNRAARRRWIRQQRRLHKAPPASIHR